MDHFWQCLQQRHNDGIFAISPPEAQNQVVALERRIQFEIEFICYTYF